MNDRDAGTYDRPAASQPKADGSCPDRPDAAETRADGFDVISDVLDVFRVRGAALLAASFTAPWAFETPPAATVASLLHGRATNLVIFHIVARGRCWLEVDGCGRLRLEAGDVVGFPHGHAHRMGEGEAEVVPIAALFPPLPWRSPPRLVHGGAGEETAIVCVYLRCDDLPFNPLAGSLPPVLLVRREAGQVGSWLLSNLDYLLRETGAGGPGASAMAARMTEMMFVEMLRLHMTGLDAADTGWLAALKDRHVRRALAAIHGRPLEPWSSERIAREAGLSRSAFDDRFRRLVGTGPMHYLAAWRLQLGARALLDADVPVALAAARAGYASEEAFSRAFRRVFGAPPRAWRRARG